MPAPEYFSIFSTEGDFTVKVKLKTGSGTFADRRMDPEQIASLISPSTGTFVTEMTFDEHPFKIEKYEINLTTKVLTIHAG